MNLNQLKWTKNIVREDGEWAYSYKDGIRTSSDFKLHWIPSSEANATKPEKGDIAILRQKARVTHVVEFVDNNVPQADLEQNNEWIYRLAKAIWMADVWNEPPHQNLIFDCSLNLQGGNIMRLENIENIKQRWKSEDGLANFQHHIKQKLEL